MRADLYTQVHRGGYLDLVRYRPCWLLVQPDGSLSRHLGPTRTARIGHALEAGHGLVRVRLGARFGGVAWTTADVNRPPNPVGACLLLSLGAPWRAIDGPVAVTGWGEGIRGLRLCQVRAVEALHTDIVSALHGRAAGDHPAGWAAEVRGFAAYAMR